MKEYKLERAYKVATMARNRLRKLSRLFKCAYRPKGSVEDVYCQELESMLSHAMSHAARAMFLIDNLHVWEIVGQQPDSMLVSCMEEAMISATKDMPAYTCLPNHWLFVADRLADTGNVLVRMGECISSEGAFLSAPTGRKVVDLGIVRQRGTHSPRALARRALEYAKAHPEDGATSENKEVRQWT